MFTSSQTGSCSIDIVINDSHTHSNNNYYYSSTLNKNICPCSEIHIHGTEEIELDFDSTVSTYRIHYVANSLIYISLRTENDYDIDTCFYDINSNVDYDYYDDQEGLSGDWDYEYNASIIIWEMDDGDYIEFSLDGWSGYSITLISYTIKY